MQSETIRQLFNGTLAASELPLPDTFENASLNTEITERLNALLNRLSDEDKASLGELMSIKNLMMQRYSEQAFVTGYRIATSLLFEGLAGSEQIE
ncbi:MAG: hypothetical protein E7546_00610 [Ruminococcaceae bacterium]|nr:hypothetical protein [Oscillospiraceae bacterium]